MAAVLLGVPVMLAVISAEIYVRLKSPYGYVTPEVLRARRPLYAPALFARHVFPLQEHQVRDERGEVLYSINALGYRGPLFTSRKPQNTIRVMIYGGSSVFDHDNPGSRDWPRRVEARLRESGYPNVEVINAGIPGHAASDSVGRLFSEGHLFDPDYVLLYDQWNEIKDFRSTQPLLRARAPAKGSETDDPLLTYRNRLDRLLCETSQLYVRLRERYYTGNLRVGTEGAIPEGEYMSTLSETALRQYRMDVKTFVDVARSAGATPILVTEGRLVAQSNTDADKKRILYEMVLLTHDGLYHAFEETDRILREVSTEKQVQLIDASKAVSGRSELFKDHVHLTDKGAGVLSEFVAASLSARLGRPQQPAPAVVFHPEPSEPEH
jgi:lysophospholipase L1-like esterase